MKWTQKGAPLYAWHGDQWYNELDKKIYVADTKKKIWHHMDGDIPFPRKTMIMITKE
jgi:hypothetical protein